MFSRILHGDPEAKTRGNVFIHSLTWLQMLVHKEWALKVSVCSEVDRLKLLSCWKDPSCCQISVMTKHLLHLLTAVNVSTRYFTNPKANMRTATRIQTKQKCTRPSILRKAVVHQPLHSLAHLWWRGYSVSVDQQSQLRIKGVKVLKNVPVLTFISALSN